MPNNLIPSPIGLQAIVNKLQVALYNGLRPIWNNAQLDGYPICYSKEKDGKRTIEYFESAIDYKNLIYAEENKFWFTNYHRTYAIENSTNNYRTKIDLYFTLNLSEVKSQITTHRADYEVRQDVLKIIHQIQEVKTTEIITGVANVYQGFDYEQADDFEPYHCFRITLDVFEFQYDLILC